MTFLSVPSFLAVAAATPVPLSLPSASGSLSHAGMLLAGVILLLLAGVYLLKNGLPMGPRGAGERLLKIRETRMLGNRQFIAVVEYEGTRVLLGLTPGKIDYLCPLPVPPAVEPSAAPMEEAAPSAANASDASAPKRFTLPLIAALLLFGVCGAHAQDSAAPLSLPAARLSLTPDASQISLAPALSPASPSAPGTAPAATASLLPTAPALPAATASSPLVNLQLGGGTDRQKVSSAIEIVAVMTLLTLAPSLVMLMTSFTRIVIVLGFVRTALGVQGAPANQIIIGISLFLTFFIMGPIYTKVNDEALQPYLAGKIETNEAMDKASAPLRNFMMRQTRPSETEFFLQLAGMGPTKVEEVPLRVVVPAFVISELRTAFQMGFLIFIPFLAIDFLVSSTLMSMGMMMMPPVVVSLPFKLLLFVLVDGWQLVIRSLVQSFAT